MLEAQEESTQETSTQRTFKQGNYTQKIFTQEYLKSLGLKTGDIILFSAKGFYPFSILIKYITWSDWSHVGMVVEKEGQLMLFESTEGGAGQNSGVQINPLHEVLSNYPGIFAFRRLSKPFDAEQCNGIEEFIKAYLGREYERNLLELFRAVYDGPFGKNVENREYFFCSELVAATFKDLKIITIDEPSNEFTPADFSDVSKYKELTPQGGILEEQNPLLPYMVLNDERKFVVVNVNPNVPYTPQFNGSRKEESIEQTDISDGFINIEQASTIQQPSILK